jgi:predicted nucleic acid-binding protein
MILVDTSVWVEHLRVGHAALRQALEGGLVLGHPAAVGELALGRLAERETTLRLLQGLPPATVAQDREVLALIERRALSGRGIGWVDAHLLAATLLSGARLLTLDRRLRTVAQDLGLEA